jgi:hypothetical protein
MAAAGVSEMNVEGGMRSPGNGEVVPQGRDASVLPCAAVTWSHSVVGEGAVFCCCDNRRRVPPSMKDACPDVAHQSSVVLCYDLAPVIFFFYHVPCYIISLTSPSAYHLPLTMRSSPLQTPLQSLGQSC